MVLEAKIQNDLLKKLAKAVAQELNKPSKKTRSKKRRK